VVTSRGRGLQNEHHTNHTTEEKIKVRTETVITIPTIPLGTTVTSFGETTYGMEALNSEAKFTKLMLPQPVTGSHPSTAVKPASQQTFSSGKAQQLLVPEVTSLK
jgi:hypothetical protein